MSKSKLRLGSAAVKPLISRVRIARRLNQLAREIRLAIPPREKPIAIIVLQGAFIFGADLLRRFPGDYPIDVAFLRCQSYGAQTYSSGHVLLMQDIEPSVDLRGRTVLLIDDILDSGLTTRFLMTHLTQRGARRVRLCVLLHRKADAVAGSINGQRELLRGLPNEHGVVARARRFSSRIGAANGKAARATDDTRPPPDFVGFQVGPDFIVGYGLDYAGKYRHLPDLSALIRKPR
jgi:hypoxanthine phosphoribosyltransferase